MELSLLEKQQVAQLLKYFQMFYGTKEPSTGSYSELDESSPSYLFEIYFIITTSS
jgi:hypothetical protein